MRYVRQTPARNHIHFLRATVFRKARRDAAVKRMADLFQASNERVNREHMAQAADAWDAVFAFLTSSPLETTAAVKRMYTNAPPQGLTVVELLAGLADIGAELEVDQSLALHRDADANRDGKVGPGGGDGREGRARAPRTRCELRNFSIPVLFVRR